MPKKPTEFGAKSESKTQGRPTLRTIAEITGFAVQTVSRALGDAPDISADTKARVRKVANEVGYIPNRAGVRLRTGKTNVIALVLSAQNDILSLTSRLTSSIAEGLRGTPYHLVVMPTFPDEDPLKPVKYIVQNGTADAVILNQIKPDDARVRYLLDQKFPFATHGRTIWSGSHAYFDYDNRAFGALAANALSQKGRSNLLLLAPPLDQNYAIEMIEGAKDAAGSNGQSLTIAQTVTSDSHRNDIRAFAREHFSQSARLDGIISASPNATMAAIAGIEDRGLTIGTELDVFSKETVPILDLFRPGILKATEDVTKAGQFLSKAAICATKSPEQPPMQFIDYSDAEVSG